MTVLVFFLQIQTPNRTVNTATMMPVCDSLILFAMVVELPKQVSGKYIGT
jgi:hypothetical protein